MSRRRWAIVASGLLLALGCKNQEASSAQAKQRLAAEQMKVGREALAAGDYERARAAFQAAVSATPKDPAPYLGIAQAQREGGNHAAAVLAIARAEELSAGPDPSLKRQRAELYERMGQVGPAIATLVELRDADQLTGEELLRLTRLQGRSGDLEGAYRTLERVRRTAPDQPAAKVVEAEILLVSGEEMLAAKLMDRLLGENPSLTSARLLRARYFLNSGYPETAEQDLAQVTGPDRKLSEVVELRARVLNQLGRYQEVVKELAPLLEQNPTDAELCAQLAETRLSLGELEEAQALVDQALRLKPRHARALYVRGRALETQGELKQAVESYQYALRSDPGLGPALSRLWRISELRGEKGEAMRTLERLLFLNEATLEEKVALAETYAESQTSLERGRKLIEEAIRREPENPRYRKIRAALGKPSGGGKQGGVQIIR